MQKEKSRDFTLTIFPLQEIYIYIYISLCPQARPPIPSLMTKVQPSLRSLDLKEAKYHLSLKETSQCITQSHMPSRCFFGGSSFPHLGLDAQSALTWWPRGNASHPRAQGTSNVATAGRMLQESGLLTAGFSYHTCYLYCSDTLMFFFHSLT